MLFLVPLPGGPRGEGPGGHLPLKIRDVGPVSGRIRVDHVYYYLNHGP